MPERSRRGADRTERDPVLQPARARVRAVPVNVNPRVVPSAVLTPGAVLALQRSVGNRAVHDMLTVQRGRVETKNASAKLAKERKRKRWKNNRRWPENQLKGRILEVTDKFLFRRTQRGYIDMNKIAANFPAIDGIADGKFRQVKAYLHLGRSTKEARRNTVARIVAQVAELSDKCEIAARRLTDHNGRLLLRILDIDAGRASTKGRLGKAPYAEVDPSPAARQKHISVLPESFRLLADTQIASYTADPAKFEFDSDALAEEMMKSMVVVVPNDLIADVKKAVASPVTVEGGGFTSTEIKKLMDAEGYTPSRRGQDKDEDYVQA